MLHVESVIALSAVVFVIGLVGVLTRRNLWVVLMSLQLMLGAGGLAFVGFNRMWIVRDATSLLSGEAFALIAIIVAAGQLAFALALVAALVRNRRSLDIEDLDLLKW